MAAFNESNKIGMELEIFVVDDIKFKTNFKDVRIDHDNKKFEAWDIKVDDDITIECKNDELAHHAYSNICIEFGQYSLLDDDWSLSGIFATKAKYWLQCNGVAFSDAKIYLADRLVIKNLVQNAKDFKDKLRSIFKMEDGVNKDTILDEFHNKSKIEFGEVYDDLMLINFKYKYPIKQGDRGTTKDMDLCLIPNKIFEKYCLEVAQKNNITYNTLK